MDQVDGIQDSSQQSVAQTLLPLHLVLSSESDLNQDSGLNVEPLVGWWWCTKRANLNNETVDFFAKSLFVPATATG